MQTTGPAPRPAPADETAATLPPGAPASQGNGPAAHPSRPADETLPPTSPRTASPLAETLAPTTPLPRPGSTQAPAGHETRPAAAPGAAPGRPGPAAFADYEVLGELGRGGMGVVYKARQTSLKRLVALKMILAGGHASDEDVARFRTEAEAVARLRHPNVVQIYEIGEQDGSPYFTLEFLDGGSLAKRLAENPLPPRAAAELTATLARAMQHAHEAGIVHRDLKPANVLFSRETPASASGAALAGASRLDELVPKITDFGLAKQLDVDQGQTRSGAIMGTPSYMAPEQADGSTDQIGPAADVYALGALLYEMLTGRPPFKAATALETLRQVVGAEPVPPRQLQPLCPRDLETIALKCLQKPPDKRYASAGELADDLGRYLAGEPIRARPTPAWERAGKWARRRPALVALLATGALAVAAMIGLVLWHSADLRVRLDAAIRANEEARRAQRLTQLRAEGQEFLLAGQSAAAAHDWPEAHLQLRRALDKIGDESELAELKGRTTRLLAEAEEQLEATRTEQAARAKHQQFLRRRDDALFSSLLFTGRDLATNVRETRAAAGEALALFGAGPDTTGAPAVEAALRGRRDEIVAQCGELLLVLADAVAQPLPGQGPDERQRQAGEALRLLDRAGALGPPTHAWHLRRARYLEQLDDGPGARRERDRAAALPAAGAADYFLVGQEEYSRGRRVQAVAALDRALRLQPDHFWAQYCLALCHLQGQRWAEARAGFTACLGRRPDFVWAYLLRGHAGGELGAFEAAEDDFQEAEKRQPDEAARYALYVNRGVVRFEQGQLDAAATEFLRAIELKPKEYQAYASLARVHQRQGKLDAAAARLDEAIRLEPRQGALYRERGLLHLKREDRAAALRDFDQAIALAPAGAPPRAAAENQLERAYLLYRGEDYPGAAAACEAVLRLQPDLAGAHLLHGEVLVKLKRFEAAEQALDRYFRHLGKERPAAEAFRDLGHARMGPGRYAEAAEAYTQALALKPQPDLYAFRGWAYLQADAAKLALRDFEEALRLDPDNGEAYAFRAHARLKLGGGYREAVADAEEALRRGKDRVRGGDAARLYVNAARVFAAVLPRVAADARLTAPAGADLTGRCEGRAVDLLRAALAALPDDAARRHLWQTVVEADRALSPVRSHAEYFRLAAQYGAAAGRVEK